MLTLLFAAFTARADTLSCVATDGPAFTYEEWSKSGGNMQAGSASSTTSWTLGEVTLFADADGVPSVRKVDWAWDAARTHVLSAQPGPSGTTVYTAWVRLFSRDGGALAPTVPEPERTFEVRCTRVRECCLP